MVMTEQQESLMTCSSVNLFSLEFNNETLATAAVDIINLAKKRSRGLVLPVNVDQVVVISKSDELKNIYRSALRIFADGMPIVWSSRLLGLPLQERVTGSDLTPEVCRLAAENRLKIFLFGAAPGVADAAATELSRKNPGLVVAGTYSPPYGFENDEEEIKHSIAMINKARPDILFLALGFPKQERFAYKYLDLLDVGPVISIGATLDFIAGNVRRAPGFVRNNGLEWLWRLCQEPRRLWRRYLVRGPRFGVLLMRELMKGNQ